MRPYQRRQSKAFQAFEPCESVKSASSVVYGAKAGWTTDDADSTDLHGYWGHTAVFPLSLLGLYLLSSTLSETVSRISVPFERISGTYIACPIKGNA